MNRRKSIVITSVLTGLAVICALAGIALLIFIFLKGEINRFEPFELDENKTYDVLYISSYDPRYLITKNQLEAIEYSMQKKASCTKLCTWTCLIITLSKITSFFIRQ
ncbi:hypothetical protein [uncultured Treponema sp.]|uniref:hypothetical protein n=1 Tax=uncultured Treponema sp. TaxID=162155 RepID=UPI0025ECF559|nr:hypothetical protein [uncultured Treponema sp.]